MNEKVNKLSCQHIVKLGETAERVKRNGVILPRSLSDRSDASHTGDYNGVDLVTIYIET